MMALILIIGIGLVVLRSDPVLRFRATYTLTASILLVAAIAARYRGDFWYGFALAGWVYFILGLSPFFTPYDIHPHADRDLYRTLLTLDLAKYLGSFVVADPQPGMSRGLENALEFKSAVAIFHSILTLPIAFVGGMLARTFAAKSREV
jgi:hypothetical protein